MPSEAQVPENSKLRERSGTIAPISTFLGCSFLERLDGLIPISGMRTGSLSQPRPERTGR